MPSTLSTTLDLIRPPAPQSAGVLVACPDARPPAYEAVAGLHEAGMLGGFLSGVYHRDEGVVSVLARRSPRLSRALMRRHHAGIPPDRVKSVLSFDASLAIERRFPAIRRRAARWRTRHFDRVLARQLVRTRPDALLVFSDVGSEFALPRSRELGIPSVLSMVHGEVREERVVMDEEARRDPEFFRLYLGDTAMDADDMAWLHRRRLMDVALADRVLVPSQHIADALASHGTPPEKITIIPYAADLRRFRPEPTKRDGDQCVFLFAGGVSQRKGIKYLLEAWRRVRRQGWRLQLLGAIPRNPGPMGPLLEGVEVLGRVPHGEVPSIMAAADVFVFPSLFEGSAVVTYEALASGLPSIVTAEAGSVGRDGIEGFVVPARDPEALAQRMERLGLDPALRARFSRAARSRAEEFSWARYHRGVADAVRTVTVADPRP